MWCAHDTCIPEPLAGDVLEHMIQLKASLASRNSHSQPEKTYHECVTTDLELDLREKKMAYVIKHIHYHIPRDTLHDIDPFV